TRVVQAHIWPQRTVISMPVAGVVATVPAEGTKSPTILDAFDFMSIDDAYADPAFEHVNDEDLLTFDVRTGEGSRTRLFDEMTTLQTQVDEDHGVLTRGVDAVRPASDPLLPIVR